MRCVSEDERMELNRKLRLQLLVQNGLFLVLLVALVALLAYVAREYRKEWDITRGTRHTLSQASFDVLKRLDGPVAVTAYAVAQDARGQNVHKSLQEFMRP